MYLTKRLPAMYRTGTKERMPCGCIYVLWVGGGQSDDWRQAVWCATHKVSDEDKLHIRILERRPRLYDWDGK